MEYEIERYRLRNLLADGEYTLPKEIQSQSREIDFKVTQLKQHLDNNSNPNPK